MKDGAFPSSPYTDCLVCSVPRNGVPSRSLRLAFGRSYLARHARLVLRVMRMVITAYGLFWRRDEVEWHPGSGHKTAFMLLGRRGANLPRRKVADFRGQRGIYVLYGNYGPHYVGLTRSRGFGERLKEHLWDEHGSKWDRFSWFGFRSVLAQKDERGLCRLKRLAKVSVGSADDTICDMEALLIKAMGLTNKADMRFRAAQGWTQVKLSEYEKYLR